MFNRFHFLSIGLTAGLLLQTAILQAKDLTLYTVNQQAVTKTLYFSGTISPIINVPVPSPTAGVIDKQNFSYGQMVKKGAILFHVSSHKVLDSLRDAKASYLNALATYQKKKAWSSSDTVLNAQDSLYRAKTQLQQAQQTYEENQHLYKLEIISRQELTQSQSAYTNAKMSLAQAKRSLKDARNQGRGNNLTIEKLRFENAKQKYDSLLTQYQHSNVLAPASGIVLALTSQSDGGSSGNSKTASGKVSTGSTISFQQVLATIGDMSGIKITLSVPEVNINNVKPGYKAMVSSPAFPNIELHGKVTEVGAQASSQGGGGTPSFPVVVKVAKITAQQGKLIRSGMEATVAVTTYTTPASIVVPVPAVTQNKQHQSVVQLYNPTTKKAKPVVVVTGKVTATNVQILSGLKVGQKIVLPTPKASHEH